jgi:NADH dehydrogenase
MAGELAEYVPILCDKYEIDRTLVTLSIVDFLPRVVTTLPEKLSARIQKRLIKMGVKLLLNSRVVEIGETHISLNTAGEDCTCEAGTVIWVAGIENALITMNAKQPIACAQRGRLLSDEYLRSPSMTSRISPETIYTASHPEKTNPCRRWWKTASKAQILWRTTSSARSPAKVK